MSTVYPTMPTVFGSITAGGGISINSGRITSAAKLGTGKFQIDIEPGTFSSPPAVVATVMQEGGKCGDGGTNRTISVTHVTNNQICLAVRDANADDRKSDRPFSFIAMAAS